jgi:hypothetical protein
MTRIATALILAIAAASAISLSPDQSLSQGSAQAACKKRLQACYAMCDKKGVGDCKGSCNTGWDACIATGGQKLCTQKGFCF